MKVDEVKSSIDEVCKALIEMKMISEMKIFEGNYGYCYEAKSLNHTIGASERFKALLQRMIVQREIEFS